MLTLRVRFAVAQLSMTEKIRILILWANLTLASLRMTKKGGKNNFVTPQMDVKTPDSHILGIDIY